MPTSPLCRRFLGLILFLSPFAILVTAQEPTATYDLPVAVKDSLRDLAARVLNDGPQAACIGHECKILVLNFKMPTGVKPVYGSELADELSTQLADMRKDIQIFDRGLLKTYERVANLPSDSPINDGDARELARGLGASAVVAGNAVKLPDNSLRLSVRWMGVKDNASTGPTEEGVVPPAPTNLPDEPQPSSPILSHSDAISGSQSPSRPSASALDAYRAAHKTTSMAGVNGVSLPGCTYMPNPPYTQKARDAKFSGSVLVEAIVGLDGKITDIRILQSPGLGLDEQVIKTLKKWRCNPAVGPNGKPVPVIVPFQINFRWY
jgi:TonB family protein